MTTPSKPETAEPNRIMQTIFGEHGNCQAACIASLLKIPLTDIPIFDPTDSDQFWSNYRSWLENHGYGLLIVNYHAGRAAELKNNYFIVGGKSLRGLNHACIYKGDQPFHDPHPDNSFFGGNEPDTIDLFLPLYFAKSLESSLSSLRKRCKEGERILFEAVENLQWCGGSDDFLHGRGKAALGYDRGPRKTMDAATEHFKKFAVSRPAQ